MVRRPASCRRLNPIEAHLGQIERIDKHVDHANRIAIVNEIIKAFGQQRPLPTIRLFNEAPHQFPHRITGRIIAAEQRFHTARVKLRSPNVRASGPLCPRSRRSLQSTRQRLGGLDQLSPRISRRDRSPQQRKFGLPKMIGDDQRLAVFPQQMTESYGRRRGLIFCIPTFPATLRWSCRRQILIPAV
jgi:hypothetical protein